MVECVAGSVCLFLFYRLCLDISDNLAEDWWMVVVKKLGIGNFLEKGKRSFCDFGYLLHLMVDLWKR